MASGAVLESGSSGAAPGSFERGFVEPPLVSIPSKHVRPPGAKGLLAWQMGECLVIRFVHDNGLHLVVSHDNRYPTWDEIKSARYRLLPDHRCFALLLPPRAEYVNNPLRPNVFELTEVPAAEVVMSASQC